MWVSRVVAVVAAAATGQRRWCPHCSDSYEEFSAGG